MGTKQNIRVGIMGVKGSGRRQKSARQRQVDGSKPRKHHHRQPDVVDSEPIAPDWLTEEEREWWTHYAGLLRGQQRLTLDTAPWLVTAATVSADFMAWRGEALSAPMVVSSEQGDKAHPAWVQYRLARVAWLKVLTEAGLTPASVSRVVLPKADDEDADDFQTFQARGALRRVK